MKKTNLLASLFTLVLLTGCGGRIVDDVPKDKPSITYKYYEAGYGGEYLKKQIAQFNARAQKGEFDFYVKGVPDPAISGNIGSILEQAAKSDKVVVPDIVLVNELDPSMSGLRGYLEPIDDVYAMEVSTAASTTGKMKIEDKITQSLKEKYNFTGHYYGLPMQAGSTGIVYNKTLFQEYGLTVPKTMAEMWDLMEAIDMLPRNTNSSINDDIYSFIYPSQALEYWNYITNAYWGQLLGVDGFDDLMELKNIDTKVVEYERYYESIYENIELFGTDGPGDSHAITTSTSHTLALSSFGQQKALMTICGDWVVNEIGSFMEKEDLGYMTTPLICDVNSKKVIAKATPSSTVFAGINMSDENAVKVAESKYIKVEKSKVDASVIPEEDASKDYIYFKTVVDSNTGLTNLIIPAKAQNKAFAKKFMAYLAGDEALNAFYTLAGSWLPYNYNFTAEQAKESGLCTYTIKAQSVGLYADSISKRYKSKGRNYSLMNPLSSDPAYVVKLLQKQTTPSILYNDIKNYILEEYPKLNSKIAEFEAANGISY